MTQTATTLTVLTSVTLTAVVSCAVTLGASYEGIAAEFCEETLVMPYGVTLEAFCAVILTFQIWVT